ncbi:MAG: hypothetical protein Q8N23_06470 [Archangium sp.]|nr:hypothetical protein [Archangium sp.]MDP3570693.1 hypothetical protein [Archangium sp.]
MDRLDTEPSAYGLREPLKRLHAELQTALRLGSPAPAKSKSRAPASKPSHLNSVQNVLDFTQRPASPRIKWPPAPRRPKDLVALESPRVVPESAYDPPRLNMKSKWRRLLLERTSSRFLPRSILVFQEIDKTKESDDLDFRVWCCELLDDAPWSYVPDGFWDGGFLKLDFPPHLYRRMPARLSLTMLKSPQPGASVRMLSEDGRPFSTFEIRTIDTLSAAQVVKAEAALLP